MCNKSNRVMVSLTDKDLEKLEKVCKETGLSKSSAMVMAFSGWYAQRENERRLLDSVLVV